uniref:Chromo domain-containing protein n=1 Tax=Panagrolaimus sp. PS1159 TaxID=55785 RepID=A0AC35FVX9_9BILA
MSDGSSSSGENEYVVEKILDKKGSGKHLRYLIKWQGYDDTSNTWEPIENCGCPELIKEFEAELAKPKGKSKSKKSEKPAASRSANVKSKSAEVKQPNRKRKSTSSSLEAQPNPKKNASPFENSVLPQTSSGSEESTTTTTEKKDEKNDQQQQRSKTPESSDNEEEEPETPIDEILPLGYTIQKIVDYQKVNQHVLVPVLDTEGKFHMADIKAVAKQNLDMALEYLIKHAV